MLTTPLYHDQHRLFMGYAALVHAMADQCIVDVSHSHQACRNRDVVATESLRITAAIPLFMVREGNRLGEGEKINADAERIFGVYNGLVPGTILRSLNVNDDKKPLRNAPWRTNNSSIVFEENNGAFSVIYVRYFRVSSPALTETLLRP